MSERTETLDAKSHVLTVDGIASDGAGVGRLPDGRAVFVHRAAPGERIRIHLTEEKKRWARGSLVEILEPSPERRPAPCPHYDRCGGCTLEHLSYGAQLHWKGRIVADALTRIGGMSVEAPEVEASPRETRYRSRISLTLRRLGGSRVVAGFHEIERPDRIVDLGGDCLLFEPEIASVLEGLRAAWGPGARALPSGRELRLTLRSLEEGVMLVIEGGQGRGDLHALLKDVEGLVAIWHVDESGVQRTAGRTEMSDSFLGERVKVGGSAFLQVNRDAGEALQRRVLDLVGDPDGMEVVEAYCGLGVLGRILARRGAGVTGIELDSEAVAGARSDAPASQRILEGRVEDRLEEALPADLVLLNPPRSGLDEEIPDVLVRSRPTRILYVSCDPATLARDLDRLSEGYDLARLEAFDLFPQTSHVETLTVLTATGG